MIIIINGSIGVGKTEVSWELLPYLANGVMINRDYIGTNTADKDNPYEIIQYLVNFYQGRRHHNFVISHIFETPEKLAQLYHSLADLDNLIFAFRLTCDEEEIRKRITKRGYKQFECELARSSVIAEIQTKESKRGDLGYVFDTTHLSTAEVAKAIWHDVREPVSLVPHNPEWEFMYEKEAQTLKETLDGVVIDIHHIGSTAVPNLAAKPIIDMIATVPRLPDFEKCIEPLEDIGYIYTAYPPNGNRRFFRKGKPGEQRTHHLHIVEHDTKTVEERLIFRDILRNNPKAREAYFHLKIELAKEFKYARTMYSEAKSDLINSVLDGARNV